MDGLIAGNGWLNDISISSLSVCSKCLRLQNRPGLIKQSLTLAQMVDSDKCR